jgi:hypothetical protein
MVNFFRSFIPNLSTIMAPLTELTKKKVGAFEWTDEADATFVKLKAAVLEATALGWQTENDPLTLYTDASTVGLGAMLVQEREGREIPLQFVSKKFSDAATRWTTIEQECFALVYSVQVLKSHLLGRHFFIKTDHRNLIFMSTCMVPKVVRWRLTLAEYMFTVIHIPGVTNVVADALSRSFHAVVRGAEREPSPDEQLAIIRSFHNELVGHQGAERTKGAMEAAGYQWPRMQGHIESFIKECVICQKFKQGRRVPVATLNHHLHGNYPMESLSIDTIGPLPEDEEGRRHIIVIVDNFSKFVELFPTHSTSAAEYVDSLLKHIGIFGLMKKIRTDGGTQFTAEVCKQLHKSLGIEHLVTAPYHPQANGMVERRNAEIMKHLRVLVACRRVEKSWSRYLSLIQRIINYSVDGSIGVAPAKIIFGDMLPLEVSMDMSVTLSEDMSASGNFVHVQDYLSELKRVQFELIAASQKHLEDEAEHRENRILSVGKSDKNTFSVGDYVLLSYPNRPPSKLSSLYRGPMIIESREREDLFHVLDLVSNKVYPVHVSRLKKLVVPAGFTREQLKDLALNDHQEFKVDHIVDHRGDPRRKAGMEFLVRWLGYEPEDDTWEPYRNVKDLAALDEYSSAHPELRLG